MNLVEIIKRLLPNYTDKEVKPIVEDNKKRIEAAGHALERQKDVAMNIYIAAGGKR